MTVRGVGIFIPEGVGLGLAQFAFLDQNALVDAKPGHTLAIHRRYVTWH